jgi:hypothetical protein
MISAVFALPWQALTAAAQFAHDHPVFYWLIVLFGN